MKLQYNTINTDYITNVMHKISHY